MAHLDDDKPIADLFLDTSIMFADIVGFTKWSTERSPNEVFTLLERLFWGFDELAGEPVFTFSSSLSNPSFKTNMQITHLLYNSTAQCIQTWDHWRLLHRRHWYP